MFAKAASSFVKQIESSGELIPVSSLNDSDKLQLLSLVTKKKAGWFWQKPKYHPSSFTLHEILTGNAPIKPVVTESTFLKYEGKFEEKVEASADTKFANLSFDLEGQDAVELKSSFGDLQKQEIDLQQLLKIVEKSTIQLNHPFVQQVCEKRNKILCIVSEKVITLQKCSISEHTQIEEKCGSTMGLKTKILKVSVDDDGAVTKDVGVALEIPARTVIAYTVTELFINHDGHFELCLLSDRHGGFDRALLGRNKGDGANPVFTPLSCVDGAQKSKQSALTMDVPAETSLIVLKPAIEEANQQFQPFRELTEENRQQLFRLCCEFLYHEEVIYFLENTLDELSAAEQPNLSGLQDLDSAQAEKVKELLQILGFSCSNGEGCLTKDIKTPELLAAGFHLFTTLTGMSEETLAVLGICCETQILPSLHYLINNVSDDGVVPVDNPDLLPLKEEENFCIAHRLLALSNVCLEVEESAMKVITDVEPAMAPVLLCIVLQGFAILNGISNPTMQT
ncbi:gasdermin Eb [Hypanus sabinus]|uniref:gasdermin Eb n=1 Tax=Hypanus sabinus TaxID=79690 RepID=UPI0028C3CFF4|nr:gasdermin Eb [Hypanus sabinus]XP_059801096.1 gasdermin Eb [Hypanus sabinus]XP_059801097.1 gasdermin Eb [Hypanus sabinus]